MNNRNGLETFAQITCPVSISLKSLGVASILVKYLLRPKMLPRQSIATWITGDYVYELHIAPFIRR